MSVLQSFVGRTFSNLLSFVDRDMLMRYHWGLAVGHVYTRGRHNSPNVPRDHIPNEGIDNLGAEGGNQSEPAIHVEGATMDNDSEGSDEEDLEFGLESRDPEDLLDMSEEEEMESEDDERLLAMDEMYNS